MGTQPGDNYKVIARKGKTVVSETDPDDPWALPPLPGAPVIDEEEKDCFLTTRDTLTVWRRLWLETDRVENAGDLETSLLESEMLKACISVKFLDYNSPDIPDLGMSVEGKRGIDEQFERDPEGKVLYESDGIQIVHGSRDHLVPQIGPDFWYVHAIAAKKILMVSGEVEVMTVIRDQSGNIEDILVTFKEVMNEYGALGLYIGNNTILVFNETIEERAGTEHPEHTIVTNGVSSPYVYPDAATLKKDTLLHEVVHLFKIDDNERGLDGNIIYDIMCYTYNSTDGPRPVIAYEHIQRMQQCVLPQ